MMTVDDDSDDNNAPERNGKGAVEGIVAAPMTWGRSFSSSTLWDKTKNTRILKK